jgi:hypothetical protein
MEVPNDASDRRIYKTAGDGFHCVLGRHWPLDLETSKDQRNDGICHIAITLRTLPITF